MKFRLRPRVNIIALFLIAGMLRLSYWQWQRHLGKLEYIQKLTNRLNQPPADLLSLASAPTPDWSELVHRRVTVQGRYDFSHEVILRNRRFEEMPGVHVLTPLLIDGSNTYVLVDRGFLPLAQAQPEKRAVYHRPDHARLEGLIKEGQEPLTLAPQDPEAGTDRPWIDAWLRPDLKKMQKQLPYPVIPIYLEIMQGENPTQAEEKIVSSKSGRDDIFFLPTKTTNLVSTAREEVDARYPIPVFDTVVSAGRHLGYVFEWALMALGTFLISVVLQFRRPEIPDKDVAYNMQNVSTP
jgi:surfeit locus 1 family protein